MTLQELSTKVQNLLTTLPAQTPVVFADDLTASIVIVAVSDDGVSKVVIGEE